MRNKRGLIGTVLCLLLSLPAVATAQNSSINTFSPYSFYGLGDFTMPGTAKQKAMGGTGIAYRDGTSINFLNPASMSSINRKSALFDVGLEGKNFYLKSSETKSSYNTFNVSHVAFAVPLADKLGMAISVMPLSSVGYRIEDVEERPSLGQINYYYTGEGDINQAKFSLGYELFKNFSLGAELLYYFGNIDRVSIAQLTPLDGSVDYKSTILTTSEHVSRLFGNFGIQYNIPLEQDKRAMTLGLTFQPKGKLKQKVTQSVPTSDNVNDFGNYVINNKYTDPDFAMPSIISGGVYYHTTKLSIGADYVYQGWKGVNESAESSELQFRNTSTIKAGLQYTPDRGDVRNFLKRVTYRVGARYSDYYMKLRGQNISDKTVTLGVGVPLKMNGFSNIDLGLEFGQRGTTKSRLVKENYWGVSVGLSLFGEDFWFMKPKYD